MTDYINIYDDKGNTFKGNKYRLRFDYYNMECKIFGEDEKYNRVSYWANNRGRNTEYLDPHPHVNGRNGDACWGSAGDMLTYSMNNYELYASYMIVYNFLQQTNLDDPAGRYIRNWDCIDDNEENRRKIRKKIFVSTFFRWKFFCLTVFFFFTFFLHFFFAFSCGVTNK